MNPTGAGGGTRGQVALFALAFVALFAVYTRTLCPAFPPNDSPETIAACVNLGIQHPPGYPLHTLAGRLAVVFWPAGSPAWRVNSFSALMAAGGAAGLGWLLMRVLGGLPGALRAGAGLGAALWLGLSRTWWQMALEAKGGVYLMHMLLLLGLLACLAAAWRGESVPGVKRAVLLFGLLTGLGLAHHQLSMLAALAVLAPLMLWRARRAGAGWGLLLGACALAVVGLSLYLELPLRAAFRPEPCLGVPDTWGQFLWVALRKGYTQAAVQGDATLRARQLAHWLDYALHDATPLLWPLALAGGAWLAVDGGVGRWAAAVAGLVIAVLFVAVVLVNGTEAGAEHLMDLFFAPGQALAVALACAACALAARRLWAGAGKWRPALASLPLVPAVLALALNAAACTRAKDYLAYDFGRGLALSMPPKALALVEGDFHRMPLYYVQHVEGRRRDATPVLMVLLDQAWQRRELRRLRPDLDVPETADGKSELSALSRGNVARVPVVLSPQHPFAQGVDLGGEPAQAGLMKRLMPPSAAWPAPGMGLALPWRPEHEARGVPLGALPPLSRNLMPWYSVAWADLGNDLTRQGRWALAADAYRRCLALHLPGPEAQMRHNLGQSLASAGDIAGARAALTRALEVDPSQQVSAQALAALSVRAQPWLEFQTRADRLAQDTSRRAEAMALYRKAVRLGSPSPAVRRNLGVLQLQAGQIQGARRDLEAAVALAPHDPELYRLLAYACQQAGDAQAARRALERSVAVNNQPH